MWCDMIFSNIFFFCFHGYILAELIFNFCLFVFLLKPVYNWCEKLGRNPDWWVVMNGSWAIAVTESVEDLDCTGRWNKCMFEGITSNVYLWYAKKFLPYNYFIYYLSYYLSYYFDCYVPELKCFLFFFK